MLQVHDIRQSKVWQEAIEEGTEKGLALAVLRLAAKKKPVEEIAADLDLDIDHVKRVIAGSLPENTGGAKDVPGS